MTRVPRLPGDPVLLLILLCAVLLRLELAVNSGYIHDEENTSVPLSQTISFSPGALHLPLRGENHGALPAYVVKASSAVFGTTPLGYRALHVLLGLATVLLIYRLARDWYGVVAARWSAALLAFNEYFLAVSARATAHVPHLFLVTAAIFAFSRFLAVQRPAYLYAAGAFVGLAFYCKEHSALLLPVFLLTLLHTSQRQWLRSPHAYLACATFALVIGPDLLWNLRTDPEKARVTYGSQTVGQATYGNHLERIGGLGISPYPLMFYARSTVTSLHAMITRQPLRDETPEYPSVNSALGALLLAAVAATTFGAVARDELRRFLLILFWGIFGFFTLIARGDPPGRLDPVSWIWVEVTLLPAVVVAGARLAAATGALRIAAWVTGAALLLYASVPPGAGVFREGLDAYGTVLESVSHAAQVLALNTVAAVRNHPLRAVAIAMAVGLALGSLVAAGWGRFTRSRLRGRGHG